jgi:uncharacterized repeat protein (TIGR03803 family)
VLYYFEAQTYPTGASQLGSEPDTRPALGPGNTVYGMAYGGQYANGVTYQFDLQSHQYTVLHTFSALNANGDNKDGADPGVALTLGPDGVFYGMASFGGENGNGTIFKITTSGEFAVLHTFSALDTNGNNEDGANPLRTVVVGNDGNLYGTTRLGGQNTCLFTHGCGVAWVMDRWGNNFSVLHQFTADEGHAASLLQARDGFFYGCAVWPATSLPPGPLPSGILYRMEPAPIMTARPPISAWCSTRITFSSALPTTVATAAVLVASIIAAARCTSWNWATEPGGRFPSRRNGTHSPLGRAELS